jgi:uncharacterized protein (TIGR00251 family)
MPRVHAESKMSDFAQKDANGFLRLSLHVQPGARKTELAGLHAGALKVRIAAAPEDGAANKALCEFLASFFGIAKTSVSILQGQSSRKKTILIQADAARIQLILEQLQLQI